jgi:hypothetical protein
MGLAQKMNPNNLFCFRDFSRITKRPPNTLAQIKGAESLSYVLGSHADKSTMIASTLHSGQFYQLLSHAQTAPIPTSSMA